MQKKLALACTLVHAPQVIFLDEPTTGVDPISRREFWDILANLHVQGVTLFVSTPYMDEAERCSRVGLMYEGRIVECDTPDALRKRVPGDLLSVWTSDVPGARRVVRDLPGVLEVQTYGDVLHVFVNDAATLIPVLRDRAGRGGRPCHRHPKEHAAGGRGVHFVDSGATLGEVTRLTRLKVKVGGWRLRGSGTG